MTHEQLFKRHKTIASRLYAQRRITLEQFGAILTGRALLRPYMQDIVFLTRSGNKLRYSEQRIRTAGTYA